jgi:phosphoglucosamine mutase
MRKNGFNLGGEQSGHLIFHEYATTGDGILSALQVLRILREEGVSLAQFADCMEEYPQTLVSLKVKEKKPLETAKRLSEVIRACEADLTGRGRVIVRYSGTESKIRLLVEACEQKLVDGWIGKLKEAVAEDLGSV